MNILAKILGFLVIMIVATLWSAYVLTKLWGWFVIPTFELPELSVAAAVGLALIVSYLTYQHRHEESTGDSYAEVLMSAIFAAFMRPLFALILGAIVSNWM